MGHGGDWRIGKGWDIALGNLEEDKLSRLCCRVAAAQISRGDAGSHNGCDGVVGVKFAARTAVGVHVREDADGAGVARIDEDDSVLVGGHGDRADLVASEGYVEFLIGDGFVGLRVDDPNLEWMRLLGIADRRQRYAEADGGSNENTGFVEDRV